MAAAASPSCTSALTSRLLCALLVALLVMAPVVNAQTLGDTRRCEAILQEERAALAADLVTGGLPTSGLDLQDVSTLVSHACAVI